MGTEIRTNQGSSESNRKWNDFNFFLSPFFCQPFEASQPRCRHEREVSNSVLQKRENYRGQLGGVENHNLEALARLILERTYFQDGNTSRG